MATPEQIQQAMRLARQAGDTQAVDALRGRLLAAYHSEVKPVTAEMSTYERAMAGAGKSVVDTGRGLKQIGLEVADKFRSPQPSDLIGGTPAQRSRAQMDEVQARDADLMSTGAGLAGNIAGTLATTLVPAGLAAKAGQATQLGRAGMALLNPQSLRAAAAGGAALGAAQPVGTNDSRTLNALLGGAVGGGTQALIKTAGRIAQPIRNALSATDQTAVDVLERAGVQLDAAQRSGSQRAMQLKRFLTDNPLTAPGQIEQAQRTARGFNRAALSQAGEAAEVADEEVLGKAARRLGQSFDDIAARNPIKADDELLNALSDISAKATAELESTQAPIVLNQVDEIINKAAGSGSIDGKAYQNIKSTLDRISNGGNPQVGHWARAIRSELDEALQRSASEADYAALKDTRKQYGALQKIIDAVSPEGNVSPAKLYNTQNVKSYGQKKAMATGIGQTDLQRLAKAGKQIIPERLPQSGTAPRALLQAALPAGLGALYGVANGGDVWSAARWAALGAGAPYLAQRALNSPTLTKYLIEGLRGGARKTLQAPRSIPGGVLTRSLPTAASLALYTHE